MEKKEKTKRPYQKPALKPFGSVKDLTKTSSAGGSTDGGAVPFQKMGTMGCVSTPPLLTEHRNLVGDMVTQTAFSKAIEANVKPGDVVVDLGTGTGLHTLMACRQGAKKVYAIESGPAIDLAKEIVEANGFSDRVEFIHEDSKMAVLPEKADAIISNIGFLYSIKYLPDAARRFLKPGGKLLPSHGQISFVPYSDEEIYQQHVGFWQSPHFGFNFSAAYKMAAYHPQYAILKTDGMLSEGQTASRINFANGLEQPLKAEFTFTAQKSATMHAIGGWYSFFCDEKPLVSTVPPLKLNSEIWTNFVLPLEKPISVTKGEQIQVSLTVDFDIHPTTALWYWSVATDQVKGVLQTNLLSIVDLKREIHVEPFAE